MVAAASIALAITINALTYSVMSWRRYRLHSFVAWRKSTYSSAGDCVDMGRTPAGCILIRNSNWPAAGTTVFTQGEMLAFLEGAKAGEFDDLVSRGSAEHSPGRDRSEEENVTEDWSATGRLSLRSMMMLS